MRQTISGLIAAVAVVTAGTVPASACGLFQSECGQSYAAPVYSGCGVCGSSYERLPDPAYQYGAQAYPAQQYYYVNQGPTYTGPGDFAPYPTYQEGAVSGWGGYHHRPHYYGYNGYHHPWHAYTGYHGWSHQGYGYAHHYTPHYSLAPHGYYAPHHSIRYGYQGMPHHYGYRGYPLRRYY